MPRFVAKESPDSVRSNSGDNRATAEGSGRPSSRARTTSAAARFPPADPPPTKFVNASDVPANFVSPGDYSFGDIGAELRTGNHRKFAGTLRIIDGDFYDGRRKTQLGDLTWRPSPHFRTNVSYELNEITLPQGDFETRLVRFGFDVVFSSTLSWVNLIQYDNVSDTAGVNMRLHWIPVAGREVFFVINQNLEDYDLDGEFHSAVSDVTAKISYTFRF